MGFKNGKVLVNVFISTILPNASYALKGEVGSDSGMVSEDRQCFCRFTAHADLERSRRVVTSFCSPASCTMLRFQRGIQSQLSRSAFSVRFHPESTQRWAISGVNRVMSCEMSVMNCSARD